MLLCTRIGAIIIRLLRFPLRLQWMYLGFIHVFRYPYVYTHIDNEYIHIYNPPVNGTCSVQTYRMQIFPHRGCIFHCVVGSMNKRSLTVQPCGIHSLASCASFTSDAAAFLIFPWLGKANNAAFDGSCKRLCGLLHYNFFQWDQSFKQVRSNFLA